MPRYFPPHYDTDEKGNPVGFAIDVMNAIAKRAGLTVHYSVYDNWDLAQTALKTGQAQVIPNMGITSRRSEYAEFTSPLETFEISYFIRASAPDINTLEDLEGRRIGTVQANVGHSIVSSSPAFVEVMTDDLRDLVLLLLSGQVDAIIYPAPLVWRMARMLGIEDRIASLEPPAMEVKRAMAVARGNTALLVALDREVRHFVTEDEFEHIYVKWYGRKTPYWSAQRILLISGGLIFLTAMTLLLWRYRSVCAINRKLVQSMAERDAAQKALALREHQYSLVAQNLMEGIWVVDKQDSTIFVNSRMAEMLGLDESRLLSTKLQAFLPEDERLPAKERLQALREGHGGTYDVELRRADGTIFPTRLVTAPIQNETGEYDGTLACVLDMSETVKRMKELRVAQTTLSAASRTQSEFLAMMSHEIRTPLNGLLSMLQLLDKTRLDKEQRGFVDNALRAGRGLITLLNDVLDISRLAPDTLTVRSEPLSIAETLKTVVDSFAPEATTKGLTLGWDMAPNIPDRVYGDAQKLRQVLFNLLGNAIKFTERGGVVIMANALPYRPNQRLVIHIFVADTGIGFSENRLETSFDLQEGSSPEHCLGLGIVKRMISLMGGTLSVESAETQGTTVHFTFQVDIPAAPPYEVIEDVPAVMPEILPCILVAEDDRLSRIALERFLTHLGYPFRSVTTGKEVLDLLAQEEFGCILMDVQMPVLDGLQTTRIIRERLDLGDKAQIPIVALTAFAMEGDRDRFIAAGMNDYLPKPVELEELERLLANIAAANGTFPVEN